MLWLSNNLAVFVAPPVPFLMMSPAAVCPSPPTTHELRKLVTFSNDWGKAKRKIFPAI